MEFWIVNPVLLLLLVLLNNRLDNRIGILIQKSPFFHWNSHDSPRNESNSRPVLILVEILVLVVLTFDGMDDDEK